MRHLQARWSYAEFIFLRTKAASKSSRKIKPDANATPQTSSIRNPDSRNRHSNVKRLQGTSSLEITHSQKARCRQPTPPEHRESRTQAESNHRANSAATLPDRLEGCQGMRNLSQEWPQSELTKLTEWVLAVLAVHAQGFSRYSLGGASPASVYSPACVLPILGLMR